VQVDVGDDYKDSIHTFGDVQEALAGSYPIMAFTTVTVNGAGGWQSQGNNKLTVTQ
jgi:hypothetical protein